MHMKSKFQTFRLLLATAAIGAFASFAYAGPGPQTWDTLRSESQFKGLKAGETVAYVCNECKTVSEIAIDSPAKAMELCKEHSSVTCPSCKKVSKVVMKRQRSDPATHNVVTYTNEKGEECAFMAVVVAKK